MTKREMIMAAVENLGYRPQIDDEGDVLVRYQMKAIYILVGAEEEAYVSLVLPKFIEIEEGGEGMALTVCNKVSREMKLVKVYVDATYRSVSASCDAFYTDEECLALCIKRALGILGLVRSAYYNAKAELSD